MGQEGVCFTHWVGICGFLGAGPGVRGCLDIGWPLDDLRSLWVGQEWVGWLIQGLSEEFISLVWFLRARLWSLKLIGLILLLRSKVSLIREGCWFGIWSLRISITGIVCTERIVILRDNLGSLNLNWSTLSKFNNLSFLRTYLDTVIGEIRVWWSLKSLGLRLRRRISLVQKPWWLGYLSLRIDIAAIVCHKRAAVEIIRSVWLHIWIIKVEWSLLDESWLIGLVHLKILGKAWRVDLWLLVLILNVAEVSVSGRTTNLRQFVKIL